jgi:hypothetical protein
MVTKPTIKPKQRPLCEACSIAPAELKYDGRSWKKRCWECQRAFQLKSDRERLARQKIRMRAEASLEPR